MKQILCAMSLAIAVVASGCGSGGGSNQCTSRDPLGAAPCSADTRTCYVSVEGRDTNDGSASDAAHAFRTIDKALSVVQSNYTILIGPGTYSGGISTDREGQCAPEALSLIADSARSPVVIDARNAVGSAGIRLSNGDKSIIDGFTIINSPGSGILVKSQSDGLQIRNCIIHGSGSDGIHIQDSSDVLVFNNLVYGNNGIGIALVGDSGSPNSRIINNTVAFNIGRGVEIGRSNGSSSGAFTRNNIIQENASASAAGNIKVFDNSRPYDGDFNLVFPPTYIRADIRGPDDQIDDARFTAGSPTADPSGFRLRLSSPAIDTGASSSADLGSLAQLLVVRSTTTANTPDQIPIDIGYHFAR